MSAPTFTVEQREAILEYAAERSDRLASLVFGVAEPTLRSWRHRDHRAGRADAAGDREAGGVPNIVADELADVQVPTDEWDAGRGEAVKVPARARALERFEIGSQFVSRGELRELRGPGTSSLAVGDLVLLGGVRYASFGDALWAAAERRDGVLLVRPAKIRRDEKVTDDRCRIVAKGPEDAPPGFISPEERQRMWNEQPNAVVEWHKGQLAALQPPST